MSKVMLRLNKNKAEISVCFGDETNNIDMQLVITAKVVTVDLYTVGGGHVIVLSDSLSERSVNYEFGCELSEEQVAAIDQALGLVDGRKEFSLYGDRETMMIATL